MNTILNTLTSEQLEHLIPLHLNKGEVLFHENDRCETIGILLHGEVSIVSYLSNGKEIIYNTLKDGDLFGNNLIFSSDPRYKGDILALKDTDLCLIDRDVLVGLLQENASFLLEYLRIQSNLGKSLNNRIRLLSIDSAEERLLFLIHENQGTIRFSSVSSLARDLFLERETLSRLLSRLQKEKRILRQGKMLKLL